MGTSEKPVTLYLRNVPAAVVREAKVKAAREGKTLTAVVTDALTRALEPERATERPAEDELRESREWYEANHERLLRKYQDEYVAIVDRAVIDHDQDFESLANRVFGRLGVKPIFMPRMTGTPERARVRSPRRRVS